MNKRRLAFCGLLLLLIGAALWLVQMALYPRWGGDAAETVFARRARSQEWSRASASESARWQKLNQENAPGWYATFSEPVQTQEAYQSQNPMRPTSARRTLVLLPLGTFSSEERRQLEQLRQFCAVFFALPTRLEAPVPLETLQVSSRAGGAGQEKQLSAGAILKQLEPRLPPDAFALLAVTNRDLWSRDLNFVFGLASLQNRVGVYSLARYKAKGENARAKELRRACQVLGHETGHMFGITHCVFYRCSMNGANSLGDADGAPLDFCPACERKLKWNIGYEPQKRAEELSEFYARHFPPRWVTKLD